jgi:hypothetical protein
MVDWSHREHNKVMRLKRTNYRVEAPIVQDVFTTIVEPDVEFPLSLSARDVGTQKVAFILPGDFDSFEPWDKEHVDELLTASLSSSTKARWIRRRPRKSKVGAPG